MTPEYTHISNGGGIQVPDTIIVHAMGEFIGKQHAVPFLSKEGVSAHSLVDPYGTNFRCRDDNEIAWHAKGFNTNSLGIEYLAIGEHDRKSFRKLIKTDYITDIQYQIGLEQIQEWLELWDIKKIKRHSDVSPNRKVDPGTGFPWEKLLSDLGWDDGLG